MTQPASVPTSPRIVADIGGTNGRFAIVRDGRIEERRDYATQSFDDFVDMVRRYLDDVGSADDEVGAACLAVAAPISADGEARFTNARLIVSKAAVETAMPSIRVSLINDFAAQAYGLETLADGDTARIGGERPNAKQPRVVLGPGTGLGCAALVPNDDQDGTVVAVTSEGGHATFGAETDADRRIFDAARERYGRVSWERVCCGAGLALVHRTLYPDDALDGVTDGHPGAVVETARADASSRAARSVAQWSGMLGAFAGDLALTFRAAGGVYLTGGVLAHLGPAFDAAAFLARFVAKGRYRDWMSELPVMRITAEEVAMRGCAHYLELLDGIRARI